MARSEPLPTATPYKFSESDIRQQMAAGSDFSIPLHERPASSPAVRGVVIADIGRPTARTSADVIQHDTTQPARSSVIKRYCEALDEIQVQQITYAEKGAAVQDPSVAVVGSQKVAGVGRDPASVANGRLAERPPPADDGGVGVAQPDCVVQDAPRAAGHAADGVGVQPTAREVTTLNRPAPVNVQGVPQPQTVAAVVPQPAALPPAQIVGVSQGQPAASRVRHTVTIASPTLGRHRVKVDYVGVSPQLVVLAYIDTDDTPIFEPPANGSESPLTVTLDGVDYECAYFGFSVTMSFGSLPVFQVVLVRLSE